MAFALYGKTPEVGTSTGDLVSLGKDNGEVRLTFQMDAQVWRATRRFGKKAPQPRHLLERLASDGGETLEVADGEAEVNQRLVRILGLGYEAFTSTVLLAQGQFARFFASKPGERDEILREIFAMPSLEPVRVTAIALAGVAGGRASALAAEGQRWAADWATIAGAARRLRSQAAAFASVRRLGPLAAAWQVGQFELESMRAEYSRLAGARADLPDPSRREKLNRLIEALSTENSAAEAAARTHQTELDAMRRTRAEAEQHHGGSIAELVAARADAEQLASLIASLPARETELAGMRETLIGSEESLNQREAFVNGELQAAASLLSVADAVEQYLGVELSVQSAQAQIKASQQTLISATKERDRAEAELTAAEDAIRASQLADHAAHLRSGLAAGDSCPVCGSVVAALPAAAPATSGDAGPARARVRLAHGLFARASAACERASTLGAEVEAALIAARGVLPCPLEDATAATVSERRQAAAEIASATETPSAAIAAARTAIAESRGTADEIERQIVVGRSRVAQLEGATTRRQTLEEISAALTTLQVLEQREQELVVQERTSRSNLEDVRGRVEEMERAHISAVRQAVAIASTQIDEPSVDPSIGPTETLLAAERLVGLIERKQSHLAGMGDATAAQVASLASELRDHGVDDPSTVSSMQTAAETSVDDARQTLAGLFAQAADSRRLAAQARAETVEQGHLQAVADDLKANQFPRFLLSAAREQLAAAASLRLQDLSAGSYRFAATEPDPLAILDVRRDATRAVATLSGGERFLASLSLALALGDIAAGAGGRLDCLFLDEGFSTLDAESLELAVAGIERLSGQGRLIGVITHLPGMAERLGAAIRVSKDPAGVSRIVES